MKTQTKLHKSEGNLWRGNTILRQDYAFTHRNIETGRQLRSTLRAGEYAWPGGYQMFFITSDGAALCFDCVKSELRSVLHSIKHNIGDGWRVIACDVNWEDNDCYCDHCSKQIPASYGD